MTSLALELDYETLEVKEGQPARGRRSCGACSGGLQAAEWSIRAIDLKLHTDDWKLQVDVLKFQIRKIEASD
jgi:hypothetical protein